MIRKFCHDCWKWKPISCFPMVHLGARYKDNSNYCEDCSKDGKHYKKMHNKKYSDVPINTFKENTFLVGFMGKTPYKEICKVYNIKYEPTPDPHS